MTPTNIVNIALRRCGANRIGSLESDSSKEAIVARDLYQEARRDMLNSHTWNWAIKRVELDEADTPAFGWDYAFALPDDFIRVISVHPYDDESSIIPYKLEFQDDADRVLVTNVDQVYLRYVADIEDPTVMSAAFRDTLAWRLTRDFANALAKSSAASTEADRQYQRQLMRAKFIDSTEDYPEDFATGSWLASRSGMNTR